MRGLGMSVENGPWGPAEWERDEGQTGQLHSLEPWELGAGSTVKRRTQVQLSSQHPHGAHSCLTAVPVPSDLFRY